MRNPGRKVLGTFILAIIGVGVLWSLISSKPKEFASYPFKISNGIPLAESYKFHSKRLLAQPSNFLEINSLAELNLEIYKQSGDRSKLGEAEAFVERSLKVLSTPNVGALCVRAKIFETRHQFAESIDLSKKILSLDGTNSCALTMLISANAAIGNLSEAANYVDILMLEKPLAENHIVRAKILEAQGRYDEAQFDYKRFFEKEEYGDPDFSALARYYLSRYYFHRGNLDEAERIIRIALEISRKKPNPEFFNLLGDIQFEKSDLSNAEKSYLDALRIRPGVGSLRRLAILKLEKSELSVANDYLTQAEKIVRDELANSFGHNLELIRILLIKNTKESLEEAGRLALAEVKKRPTSEMLLFFSQTLSALGAYRPAFAAIQSALKSGFASREYYLQAALVEKYLNNPKRAEFYLTKAKNLSPHLQKLNLLQIKGDSFKNIAVTR